MYLDDRHFVHLMCIVQFCYVLYIKVKIYILSDPISDCF